MKHDKVTILSLYPNARGIGYACVELPQNLKETGIISIRAISNEKILERITKFIDFFNPKVIVLRDYGQGSSRQERRSIELIETLTAYARQVKLSVHLYSREQIKDVFEQFDASTKYQIALKLISWFPHLQSHAPRIRKPWMAESYHMSEFDALSLAVTHQYLTE